MSKYTTGEIAKLCGVTVRTVQYYDNRNLLSPSELSEGGRRLYSEDDLSRMKIICFLKEIGLSLNNIATILSEENSKEVISLLLDQQQELLKEEIHERQEQLQSLNLLSKALRSEKDYSVDSLMDMARKMKSKKQLRKIRATILTVGLAMDAIEAGTLILWIKKGIYLPFALGMITVIAMGIWISYYYFNKVAYICPHCHKVFKPRLKEAFWANHTPSTRKLRCPECGVKSFCVEVAAES